MTVKEQMTLLKRGACWSCPIGCKRVTQVGDEKGEGPEYESIYALGSSLDIDDDLAIKLCSEVQSDYGKGGFDSKSVKVWHEQNKQKGGFAWAASFTSACKSIAKGDTPVRICFSTWFLPSVRLPTRTASGNRPEAGSKWLA